MKLNEVGQKMKVDCNAPGFPAMSDYYQNPGLSDFNPKVEMFEASPVTASTEVLTSSSTQSETLQVLRTTSTASKSARSCLTLKLGRSGLSSNSEKSGLVNIPEMTDVSIQLPREITPKDVITLDSEASLAEIPDTVLTTDFTNIIPIENLNNLINPQGGPLIVGGEALLIKIASGIIENFEKLNVEILNAFTTHPISQRSRIDQTSMEVESRLSPSLIENDDAFLVDQNNRVFDYIWDIAGAIFEEISLCFFPNPNKKAIEETMLHQNGVLAESSKTWEDAFERFKMPTEEEVDEVAGNFPMYANMYEDMKYQFKVVDEYLISANSIQIDQIHYYKQIAFVASIALTSIGVFFDCYAMLCLGVSGMAVSGLLLYSRYGEPPVQDLINISGRLTTSIGCFKAIHLPIEE